MNSKKFEKLKKSLELYFLVSTSNLEEKSKFGILIATIIATFTWLLTDFSSAMVVYFSTIGVIVFTFVFIDLFFMIYDFINDKN